MFPEHQEFYEKAKYPGTGSGYYISLIPIFNTATIVMGVSRFLFFFLFL